MKILIYDAVQKSNSPAELRSAALADFWVGTGLTITLNSSEKVNSFGIGNTDASEVTVNGQTVMLDENVEGALLKNGLYSLIEFTSDTIVMSHNGTFIGRFAVGYGHNIGVSPANEPGWWTTNQRRVTPGGGQVVPGAGGITGRRQDVDVRYKITRAISLDIQRAYPAQIGLGMPYFIEFEKEAHRFHWLRLYGYEKKMDIVLQSSVNYFLYSKRWSFMEAF